MARAHGEGRRVAAAGRLPREDPCPQHAKWRPGVTRASEVTRPKARIPTAPPRLSFVREAVQPGKSRSPRKGPSGEIQAVDAKGTEVQNPRRSIRVPRLNKDEDRKGDRRRGCLVTQTQTSRQRASTLRTKGQFDQSKAAAEGGEQCQRGWCADSHLRDSVLKHRFWGAPRYRSGVVFRRSKAG